MYDLGAIVLALIIGTLVGLIVVYWLRTFVLVSLLAVPAKLPKLVLNNVTNYQLVFRDVRWFGLRVVLDITFLKPNRAVVVEHASLVVLGMRIPVVVRRRYYAHNTNNIQIINAHYLLYVATRALDAAEYAWMRELYNVVLSAGNVADVDICEFSHESSDCEHRTKLFG